MSDMPLLRFRGKRAICLFLLTAIISDFASLWWGANILHQVATVQSVGNDMKPDHDVKIPRTLFMTWITSIDDMPPRMASNIRRWQELNPEYTLKFFNDTQQEEWMQQYCEWYYPAWKDLQLPAGRADLFRYCLVYTSGGVWSDVDIVPLEPLSQFLPSNSSLLLVHDGGMGSDGYLYNAFFAASPRHAVIARALEIVQGNYQKRLRRAAVDCTGPGVLWHAANDTLQELQGKDYVGHDHGIEYLSFDGDLIYSSPKKKVLKGKYEGYLEDASTHGGEPHYGREVTWATAVDE